jgi:hypothetical protein
MLAYLLCEIILTYMYIHTTYTHIHKHMHVYTHNRVSFLASGVLPAGQTLTISGLRLSSSPSATPIPIALEGTHAGAFAPCSSNCSRTQCDSWDPICATSSPTGVWNSASGTLTLTAGRQLRDAVVYTFSFTLTNPASPQVAHCICMYVCVCKYVRIPFLTRLNHLNHKCVRMSSSHLNFASLQSVWR